MKRLIKPGVLLAGGALAGVLVVNALGLSSNKPSKLNFGQQLNSSLCVKAGKQVISVTQKVVNTIDSGEAGNYWAFDNLNREIKVWEQEGGTYCAIVKYQGQFDGQEGQRSPGNGGVLGGDEDGTFEGGYRATISGTLKASPSWNTKGSVGETDYKCDLSGNCPGAVNWVDQYFTSGSAFSYDWWGWIYHGGKNGTWVNSLDGNEGDIL